MPTNLLANAATNLQSCKLFLENLAPCRPTISNTGGLTKDIWSETAPVPRVSSTLHNGMWKVCLNADIRWLIVHDVQYWQETIIYGCRLEEPGTSRPVRGSTATRQTRWIHADAYSARRHRERSHRSRRAACTGPCLDTPAWHTAVDRTGACSSSGRCGRASYGQLWHTVCSASTSSAWNLHQQRSCMKIGSARSNPNSYFEDIMGWQPIYIIF